ncbi:MAG: prolipoprotein diacylglyceryl transferase family protein [Acidimicrobiales bacterium]
MSGVPISFHLGPLVFHTYGLGLAIAAYVCYLYARKRLASAGFDVALFGHFTFALIASGLIGARLANIATNWSYYSGHPQRWIAVWQGGLASFGGIALALPIGLYLQRRWWPESSLTRFTDALVPALLAGWALGRVLGPQFMVNGGGHLTHQWFGISYHDQFGKRIPVPLIQGLEDALLWLGLLGLERTWARRATGIVTGVAMLVWGVVRSTDERLLLGQASHSGSLGVQIAGLSLALAGVVLLVRQARAVRSTPDRLGDPSAQASPRT